MISSQSASAIAHPNIAFIKYWGNQDQKLRIPSNGSISMTLSALETETSVSFYPTLEDDKFILNQEVQSGPSFLRVSSHLDVIRKKAGFSLNAEVISQSNFPFGAGIASSASGFAALTVAAAKAAKLNLNPTELSRIARLGSGSACRSIFGGYVEWEAGTENGDSYATQIADQDYWELSDLIVIVEKTHKEVGSTSGHKLADTSPLQKSRVQDAARRLEICRKAILERDFPSLSSIIEEDSNMMHAVMMTSNPQLIYWRPETISIMKAVQEWRHAGMEVCFTIDAGPNVHCICTPPYRDELNSLLKQIPGVIEVVHTTPGGPARLTG
jgi:diphosphomevalonate decarboxylase